ncbi:MAG TPA: hypothetical protein VM822_17860 [Pseudolabrys sp.]|jgi:hypothetical protein|nr:hypothetical protein [Pseudolabrys sp.]
MSIPCKFERSILSYDEHEIILRSHHPEIYDGALDDLKALRQRLREMRDKERTLARENRRAVRGKGEQRGASFPDTAEHLLQRKQVFDRRVETREQGDQSHAQARGPNRTHRSGPPCSRRAPCGPVSYSPTDR